MIDEHDLKQIPYGIADFEDFRKKNLYYVDKTRFIHNIEKKGSFLFFIRPRRFGKSLFLSMMEYYYDVNRKDQFDYLFNGTAIHQNPTKEKNNYLVLSFNFSAVAPDKLHLEKFFLQHIRDSVRYFMDKYGKHLDIDIKEAREQIDSSKGASALMGTFLNYFKGKKYKLYVFIDEYDNFANTILSDSGEEEYRSITRGEGFLRAFFNVIKAGTTGSDTPISRLFMTGVSPITLDDVTSGFNIATNISLDDDINEILGFDKTEVETLIEYYRQTGKIQHSTPELVDIMGQWYNHYRFSLDSECEVFNTISVLYFIREYLKKSRIPNLLLDHNTRMDYSKLRQLIIIDKQGALKTNGNFSKLLYIIENGSVHSDIETSFPIHELSHPKKFTSLLYYFGLLTFSGMDDENTPILSIPNEMVKHLYYAYIKETYEETGILSLDTEKYESLVRDLAYKGNWKGLIEYISGRMEASLSLRDLMTGEKVHQVFWNIYLGLNKLYNVYSERELNQGFADLVLEPQLAQNPGLKFSYLIEIKYIKPAHFEKEDGKEKLQALRAEAESQLNRCGIDEKFRKTIGQTTLKKLALIFCGNRLVYYDEVFF